eukprot:Clim_evm52s134 gene=Clim_evmTU52s134
MLAAALRRQATTVSAVRQQSSRARAAIGFSVMAGVKRSYATVEDDVLVEQVDSAGIITMNRPKALNSLNMSMINKMQPAYTKFEEDDNINVVVLKGVGKGFCAGGDVRHLAEAGLAGDLEPSNTFYRTEYQLDYHIGTLTKPHVSIIDGICMGGGVGVSVHGMGRVVTENCLFAMPETGIGLVPDVGGSWFLPRLQGELGMFLGLTGYRLKGGDVYHAGVGTHYVPSEKLADLERDLARSDDIQSTLDDYHQDPETPFTLAEHMDLINRTFDKNTVEEIVEALRADGSEFALKQVNTLAKMSPTSCKLTMRQLRDGAKMTSLAECLKMELRLVLHCAEGTDFYEGVGAVLIHKHNSPKWNPDKLEDVSQALVDKHFGPIKEELVLPERSPSSRL